MLAAIASEAGERLDVPVNVTRLSIEEWETDDLTPFVATLRSRPTLDVMTGNLHV
ncbi:hypothetical protein GCM10009585_19340 [Brevibacterium paucivorans]|uniref:hypothetical protein n=1 Tax=Brevibacterium paucivorans TaxID=170994 RepID=UPI0015E0A2A4